MINFADTVVSKTWKMLFWEILGGCILSVLVMALVGNASALQYLKIPETDSIATGSYLSVFEMPFVLFMSIWAIGKLFFFLLCRYRYTQCLAVRAKLFASDYVICFYIGLFVYALYKIGLMEGSLSYNFFYFNVRIAAAALTVIQYTVPALLVLHLSAFVLQLFYRQSRNMYLLFVPQPKPQTNVRQIVYHYTARIRDEFFCYFTILPLYFVIKMGMSSFYVGEIVNVLGVKLIYIDLLKWFVPH